MPLPASPRAGRGPRILLAPLIAAAVAAAGSTALAADRLVWFGASAGTPKVDGIYAARFDDVAGTLSPPVRVTAVLNPMWLEVHPRLPVLYSLEAISDGGRIQSYVIDPDSGGLKPQASLPGAFAQIAIDPSGKRLFAAHISVPGGSVVGCYAVGDDGAPQPQASGNTVRFSQEPADKARRKQQPNYDPVRQAIPWMKGVAPSADGRFVIACNFGLDKLFVVAADATQPKIAAHSATEVTTGNGPRCCAWHPNGRFVYVANELDNSVTALAFDPEAGTLTVIDTASSLPADVDDSFRRRSDQRTVAMDVAVHPSGSHVYVVNAGHDSVATFSIDGATGKPTFVATQPTRGKQPAALAIAPGGRHLLVAAQRSGDVEVMAIDGKTGRLTGTKAGADIPAPACIRFR